LKFKKMIKFVIHNFKIKKIMLEQLISMATSQLNGQLQDYPEVAGQNIDVANVAQTAGSSIFETLASQIGGGNIGGLTEMLSGGDTAADHPVAQSMQGNVVTSLIEKAGISPALATTIAGMAIPMVMNMFNKQAGQAQSGGIDMGSLIAGAMGGGGNAGGGGLLGGLLGSVLGGGNQQQGGGMGAQVLSSVLGQLMK
jgi:hypothetical protein